MGPGPATSLAMSFGGRNDDAQAPRHKQQSWQSEICLLEGTTTAFLLAPMLQMTQQNCTTAGWCYTDRLRPCDKAATSFRAKSIDRSCWTGNIVTVQILQRLQGATSGISQCCMHPSMADVPPSATNVGRCCNAHTLACRRKRIQSAIHEMYICLCPLLALMAIDGELRQHRRVAQKDSQIVSSHAPFPHPIDLPI